MIKLILVFFVVFISSATFAEDNPFSPQLPLQSAVVHSIFKLHNTNCDFWYYYKNGVNANHSECEVVGAGPSHKMVIFKNDKTIEVDVVKKTARIFGDLQTYMYKEYSRLNPKEQKIVRENFKYIRFQRNASFDCLPKIEQGELLGKTVEIVTADNITAWGWIDAGTALRVKAYGTISIEAISALANVDIPDEKLSVPEGIKPVFDKKQDAGQRKFAKMHVNMLKNPELQNRPVCEGTDHSTLKDSTTMD